MFLRSNRIFSIFAVCILSLAFAGAVAAQPTATNIFAVTSSNQLIRFNTRTPGTVVTLGPITGLQGGENVLGIDFRPLTGELFALGSNSRLYRVNKTTGAATFVATLSTALNGTSFGVDFNPTVDRLRIVSNTGQNLRVNPANGATIVDGAINGAATGADGAGYLNSFNGATATTLFDVSATTDTLYTQNPPNNGTLVVVGALGIDITAVNGFDISPIGNAAFGAFTVGGVTGLYTVNTTSGAASLVGSIGTGATPLSGFAAETATTSNFLVYGVTVDNNLIKFNSARPLTTLSSVAITGLQGGESILGIDFRPATGRLFGLGSTNRIYTINVVTGAATSVGTLTTPLLGTNFGFDFNPVPDRIRITSDLEQNLRANPNDGTNLVDGLLAYAAGDVNFGANPNIVASGYTNSFAGTTSTTLYNIDSTLGILTTQNPPNNGTLNTVGSLGVTTTGVAGFDIGKGSNTALAALQTPGSNASALYSVNLTTGSAAFIAPIGGAVVRDIAIARSTASGAATAQLDFDGDGKSDPAVFRVSDNTWYITRSSDGSFFAVPFGLSATDVLTPGDYDGDGRTDISVWRPSQGTFYVLRSSDLGVTTVQWGLPGDEPLARDYDGDGRTDYAVARRENGQLIWYILGSSNGAVRIEQFGFASDVAAPGDYDGDGRTDLAVHRGANGQQATFFVQQSSLGLAIVQWGLGGDLVVPGDYDGDGRADFAVVREGSPFVWYVLQSSNGQLAAAGFGSKPQFTTQGDYDGDGKTDFSTFDPLTGRFYWLRSIDFGITEYQFGLNGDYPVANYQTH
jgi:hypothetical protein